MEREYMTMTTEKFPTWKTVRIGTHRSVEDLSKALGNAGYRVSDWANDILGKITVSPTEKELELVVITVGDLGFKNGAKREDIYRRAQELGLDLCPAEVGPQLRLQYKDQPMGEWLLIAMEPIADSDGGLHVFNVERHGDEIWLHASCGYPGCFWYAGGRWVFVRRKQSEN